MNYNRIWQHFQNEAPEIFLKGDGRIRFLVRQLKRRTDSGAAVLNVGIGGGLFEQLAIQQRMTIYSLDPDAEAIARMNAVAELNQRGQVGSLESIPFPSETFAAVVVSEVLEHLADGALDQALAEIHRVLGPRGLLVGTVPANENLEDQLTVCPCCGERFHRWGHLQVFDEDRLRTLLSRQFAVQTIREKFFAPWSSLDWKGKNVCLVKNWFLRLGIGWPGASLYFLVIKQGHEFGTEPVAVTAG